MRNTDTKHLPFDVFSSPDFTFELSKLGTEGDIQDDLATPYNEAELLTRMPNGTVRFGGGEHVVFGGTEADDRIRSSEGDDTLWGDGGRDRLEGGAGNDALNGNDGDDIITDVFGDDNIKGGDGHDAINAGSGFDLILGGFGKDFVVAGADPKETFAGGGDDFVIAGDSSDTVFGDEGDDWIEGGAQADLLQGGNGDPFQDDTITGDDVIIGDGGNDDYDSEGGDDIMVTGPGIERNEGMLGFDWVTHKLDPQPANADMNFTGLLPPDEDNVRDRFDQVEGLSGWKHDDVLRGDSVDPADQVGHELANAEQIDRIAGLRDLIGAESFTGGNIILGGEGADIIEGRGGDDIIDGDAWLDVELEATDIDGVTRRVDGMAALQAEVFAGRINPKDIRIVRSIKKAAPSAALDRAVFSGNQADYVISTAADGTITVTDTRVAGGGGGAAIVDGTDTVRNVEQLVFADGEVVVQPVANLAPALTTFAARDIGTTSPAQTVTLTNTGTAVLTITDVALAGANPGDYAIAGNACGTTLLAGASCQIGVTFAPTAVGARTAVLRVTDNSGNVPGSVQQVSLTGIGRVANSPATGLPVLSDRAPQAGQTLTAITTSIADANSLGAFRYQWQQTPQTGALTWTNINGATNASFQVPGGLGGLLAVGRRYRVVVTFTDGAGFTETLTSDASARTTLLPNNNTVAAAPQQQEAARVESAPEAPAADATSTDAAQAPVAAAAAPVPAAVPAPAQEPVVLRASDVTVSLGAATPLTVRADVPAGARTIAVRVFRVTRGESGRRGRRLLATVYRATPRAKRYTVRLTHKALRNAKPGRYVIEVRVGASKRALGPVTSRTITIRKGRGRA
jgi:Ca2+-binding RTX toxin-like protein